MTRDRLSRFEWYLFVCRSLLLYFLGISPFFLSCFPSGKYPHIILSSAGKPPTTLNKDVLEAVIQFSPTSVGTTVQKMVELHNLSAVRIA